MDYNVLVVKDIRIKMSFEEKIEGLKKSRDNDPGNQEIYNDFIKYLEMQKEYVGRVLEHVINEGIEGKDEA